jgi:hypothetical protein
MAETITNTINSGTRLLQDQENSYLVEELQNTIMKFAAWLDKAGYASYDPYDIWGTRYGRLARRLYYEKNPLGIALTAPVILMEMICPSMRALFVKKGRFATADAQLVLAFLNLHKASQVAGKCGSAKGGEIKWLQKDGQGQTKDPRREKANENSPLGVNNQLSTRWLAKAKDLAGDLLAYSISGYSGYCWGYPFDWQNVNDLMRRHTPTITATPYCFEAFMKLFDVTGEGQYLEVGHSIADFVSKDLNDTPVGENAAAGSYTPYDHEMVVNASAYRAYVLFDAANRLGIQTYADKAWKNLRFILRSQRRDGSWLYAIDNPGEAFIDHFHTCFVLKNLHKINLVLKDEQVRRAIERGYAFYRQELFDQNGLPKSFAIQPRMQLSRLEMYNVAEDINLGTMLRDSIPEAFALAQDLAIFLSDNLQDRRGYFITRIYIGGLKHKLPFLRWPQAQLFHALTGLLVASSLNDS